MNDLTSQLNAATASNTEQGGNFSTPYNVDMDVLSSNKSAVATYVERVISLSLPVRKLMTGFTTAEFIEEQLGIKFRLSTNQKTEITRIIRDILLADVYMGDITELICSRAMVGYAQAQEISNIIVAQLFSPVMTEVKKMQSERFRDRISKVKEGPPSPQKIPGADLPETGGNIIDLRGQK